MDRNTLTGLVLIGLILTVFTIINKPSEEELNKIEQEQIAKTKEAKVKEAKVKEAAAAAGLNTEATEVQAVNTVPTSDSSEAITPALILDSSFTRETDKFRIDFSTKGGQIQALYLKEYKSYADYNKNSNEALCLFNKGDHKTSFIFFDGDQLVDTKNLSFSIVDAPNDQAILEATYKAGKIRQTYSLKNKSFNVDFKIEFIDLNGISKDNIRMNWYTSFLQTEKLLSEQRRVSTICFNE
ncbi:MAG: YidC/Oxa1 family insertase periplasmic-domain containing protein, partial [Crocinitomicaceae bacterium]